MYEKSYVLKFSVSSKENTTIPLYKRKKQIFEHINQLKNQLKDNEGFKGRDFSLKNITCHAPATNRAECTLTIEEPKKDGIDWFRDRIRTYNNVIHSEGEYDKLGSQFRTNEENKEAVRKIKENLQRRFTDEKLRETYEQIKNMEWLKTATVSENFLSPFKATSSNEKQEEDWIKAVESAGLHSEAANQLYKNLKS